MFKKHQATYLSWIFPVQSERFYRDLSDVIRSKSPVWDHLYPSWPVLLEPGDAGDMSINICGNAATFT